MSNEHDDSKASDWDAVAALVKAELEAEGIEFAPPGDPEILAHQRAMREMARRSADS